MSGLACQARTPIALWTERTALAPSPTAAATRFIEPWRMSRSTAEHGLDPTAMAVQDGSLRSRDAVAGLRRDLVVERAELVARRRRVPALAVALRVPELRSQALFESLPQVQRGDVVGKLPHLLAGVGRLRRDVALRNVVVVGDEPPVLYRAADGVRIARVAGCRSARQQRKRASRSRHPGEGADNRLAAG